MAMNGGEAREMRDAAKKAKRRLMINFSYRFSEQSWLSRRPSKPES
jgi:predicted dehydrogenase